MKNLSPAAEPVNSRDYWEHRFSSADWDAKGGREQSRVFMELLVKHLPAATYEEISAQGLSLLDCGCAEGDGTEVLARLFPRSRVGGFDFSPNAVERARASHSPLEFFVADFAELDRTADVLISSNCFEHLEDPVSALERLTACAKRFVLLLVPFRESFPPDREHVRIVHPTTFPEHVAGWRITHRILIPPSPAWSQNQLLVIYEPAETAAEAMPAVPHDLPLFLEPAPCGGSAAADEIRRDLEEVRTGLGVLNVEVRSLGQALEASRHDFEQVQSLREHVRHEMQSVQARIRDELATRRSESEEQVRLSEELQRELQAGLQEIHTAQARLIEESQARRSESKEQVRLSNELQRELRAGLQEIQTAQARLVEESQARRSESKEQVRLSEELQRELRAGLREIQTAQARIVEESQARRSEISELLRRLDGEERLRQETQSEVRSLAQMLEEQRAAAARLQGELASIYGSRLWRLGDIYWNFLRRLRRLLPFSTMVAAIQPPEVESPAAAVGPSDDIHPREELGSVRSAEAESEDGLLRGFPSLPAGRYDVVVFSIIDWDFRFQRPQQIATQYGRHGHRVFYLSTTRFLPPGGPAWELVRKAEGVAELAIRSPRPLDIYGGRLEEPDLAELESVFGELLERFALGDTVCLVQIPFWAPLAQRLRRLYGWRVVYDCMDEWSNFPGIGPAVLDLEPDLVRSADVTVATAHRLYEKLEGRAERLVLIQNGVDMDHYEKHYGENALLEGARHPVIGYYGALASWVDAALLERIALRFPEATLVLAGGVFDIDLSRIEALPNVRLLGQRPYEEMPRLLWHFDACIIPFLVNDITEATNPVKFYEYLSSGKPVVAPRLTELVPYEDLCYLANDVDGFVAAIEEALAERVDGAVRERRRAVAKANDWRERYATLQTTLADTVPLVSVVVVCHGGLRFTRECLGSLLEQETWARLEVLVIDNASPDGTPDYLRSLSDPRVRVFLQERNLGFPAANNLAIREARGEIVLLLNNDTVVPPGLTGRLVRALRDPAVGLACAATNFCGNEARVEPGYCDLSEMPRFAARRAREQAGRLMDLSVAAMYCVAARRDTIDRVGLLEESFGIGMFEDDDYSLRMRQAGYRVVCVEDAFVHHVGQASFASLPADQYNALWQKNQVLFESKWGQRWSPHVTRPGVTSPQSKVGAER